MGYELLVAGGHPPELFDTSKEALHLVALPVSRLIEWTTSPVTARSGNHAADPSLTQQLAVGAGKVGRISHDLAGPAPRPAAFAAAHLQAIDQRSEIVLVVALPWCEQESQRTAPAINTHVQLRGEATATVA